MKLLDIMLYAARAMSERKTRSALTILGIMIGPAEAVPGIKLSQGQYPQPFNTYGAVIGWQIANPQNTQYPSYKLNNVVTMTVVEKGQQVSKSLLVMGILKEFGPSFIVNVDQEFAGSN